MIESTVDDHFISVCQREKWEQRKVAWVGRSGAPDRVVFTPYVTAWVELKRPGKGAAAHQAREHAKIRAAGEYVFVADTKEGVDALVNWIKSQPRREPREHPSLHMWMQHSRRDDDNWSHPIGPDSTPCGLAPSAGCIRR